MLQMPSCFEREVQKIRDMLDEPSTQKYLDEKIEEIESIHRASYNDLIKERR